MPVDITEYSFLARDAQGNTIPAGREPGRVQQVPIGGSSQQSSAFAGDTNFVRVHADSACRIAFGANPSADMSCARLAGGATEFFGVRPGDKIAVISSS